MLLLFIPILLVFGLTADRGATASTTALECWKTQGKQIEPVQYTVALDLNETRRDRAKKRLSTALVLIVKSSDGKTYPLIQSLRTGKKYFILCDQLLKDKPNVKWVNQPQARLKVRASGPDIDAELSRTKQRLEDENNDSRNEFARWNAVALRRTTTTARFINWPERYIIPQGGMINKLISQYMDEAGERTLLADTDVDISVSLPGRPRLNETWSAVVTAPVVQADPPQAGPSPVAQPVSAQGRNVRFKIGFRDKQPWKDVRLNEAQRIDTFGYCDPAVKRNGRDFSYELKCAPAADGRIPIGIQGFEPVFVSQNEAMQIDTRLRVDGFRVPYPRDWMASKFVEVPDGRLDDVLRRPPIPVMQGLSDISECTETINVSVANIVNQRLEFPELPCKAYELEFRSGLSGPKAQILSGCLAGAGIPQPISGNKVSCWYGPKQRFPLKLHVDLLPGFEPIDLRVTQRDLRKKRISIGFDRIAGELAPIWPYAGGSPFDEYTSQDRAPRYVPDRAQYVHKSGRPCGTVTLTQTDPKLPTLKEAKCKTVPTKARITFKRQARERQGAGSDDPPPKAFKTKYTDEYALADAGGRHGGSRLVDVEEIKVRLPIQFDRKSVAEYKQRFRSRSAARKTTGVYVFSGEGCGRPGEGKNVRFDKPTSASFTWPQWGTVFDTRRHGMSERLSTCVPSIVQQTSAGKPYLTFRLDPVRASGPRRVIILANSQELQNQKITVSLHRALAKLVDAAHKEYQNKAPLSPIDVYSLGSGETLRPLFTGEDAARKAADTKKRIILDNVAPPTPDFQLLKLQPEVMGDADQLVVVMAGSNTGDNLGRVYELATDFDKKKGKVAFYIIGDCKNWPTQTKGFECFRINRNNARRVLGSAFDKLVDRGNGAAQNSRRRSN